VKSRVKGRLLEARVEDPKSVETRKEIQVFRGMVAAITTHRAARTPVGKPSRRSAWDGTRWRAHPCTAAMQRTSASGRASPPASAADSRTARGPAHTSAASAHQRPPAPTSTHQDALAAPAHAARVALRRVGASKPGVPRASRCPLQCQPVNSSCMHAQ
jgi:hypothetical protein